MDLQVTEETAQRWIKGRDYRFLRVNSALAAEMDRSPDNVAGRSDSDLFPRRRVARYRRDDDLAAECDRSVLFFEHAFHVPVRGWLTTKTPCRYRGITAVAGVARPWSTQSIHEALCIPRFVRADSTSGTIPLLEARREVYARFRERLIVRDLAERIGLNPDYLGRRFREVVGLDLHTLVRKLRVAWCLERLVGEAADLSRLAHGAGFSDQSHFTRAFKREVGVPPGAFRDTVEDGVDL